MSRRGRQLTAVIIVIILAGVSVYAVKDSGLLSGNGSTPFIVYSADAYVQESGALVSGFHNATGISTAPVKGGGSLSDARQIGQGSPADAFISVSQESYNRTFLQQHYSGWAVAFAADQMVLAYSSATLHNTVAKRIISQFSNASRDNSTAQYNSAFMNLTGGKVTTGISNPESDPAGYRGWITLEIAGSLYHNSSSYYVNRMSSNHANRSASSAAELVSPLESGHIQFLFIYRSAAHVKGLDYIQLPSMINLGSVNYSGFYSQFTYNLTSSTVHGAPIYLYVSAMANASGSSAGVRFASYVINRSASMEGFGLTPLKPALLYSSTTVPAAIEGLVKSGSVSREGGL